MTAGIVSAHIQGRIRGLYGPHERNTMADPYLANMIKEHTHQLRASNLIARSANRIAAANLLVALGRPVPDELIQRIEKDANDSLA